MRFGSSARHTEPARIGVRFSLGILISIIAAVSVVAHQESPKALDEIATALGPYRPFQLRLSMGSDYAPYRPDEQAESIDLNWIEVQDRVRRRAEDAPNDHSNTWALATVRLIDHEFDRALALLESLRAKFPGDPRIANDLGVAYFAKAEFEGRPVLLLEAFKQFEEAAASWGDPRAQFNKAVLLERLSLYGKAEQILTETLYRVDADFAGEISQLLTFLERPTLSTKWAEAEGRLLHALFYSDDPQIDAIVGRFPGEALRLGRTRLLTRWAQTFLDHDYPAAETWLKQLEKLGLALAAFGNDRLLAKCAVSIRDALPEDRTSLAKAYAAVVEAEAAYDDDAISSGLERVGDALELLRRLENPLLHWAQFLHYRFEYRRRNCTADLISKLDALVETSIKLGSPVTAGRAAWIAGRCRNDVGDAPAGIASLRRAADLFEQLPDQGNVAAVTFGAADLEIRRVAFAPGWRSHLEALALAQSSGDMKRLAAYLQSAGFALLDEDLAPIGLYFFDESVRLAFAHDNAVGQVSNLTGRALALVQLGDSVGALEDIEVASGLLATIPDPSARQNLRDNLLQVHGTALKDHDPAKAGQLYEEALQIYRTAQDLPNTFTTLVLKAELLLEAEDVDEAQTTLEKAFELALRMRLRSESALAPPSFHRKALEVTQALAGYWAGQENGKREALLTLERWRAPGEPDRLVEDLEAQPSDFLIVEWAALGDRLVCWTSLAGHLEMQILEADPTIVSNLVAALVRGMRDPTADLGEQVQELSRLLIAPVWDRLSVINSWIVITSGPLADLPLALIRTPDSGKHLIEEKTIRHGFSWRGASKAAAAKPVQFGKGSSIVAVSASAGSDAAFNLPPLSQAETEAHNVAALFDGGVFLSAVKAIREQILADLPGTDIIHLAGHTLIDPVTGIPRLLVSGPDPASQLLAFDASQWKQLAPDALIVLSSCRSAGASAARGLARASIPFLEHGASAVVASLWTTDDLGSRKFFKLFYQQLLRGLDAGQALRQAQLTSIRQRAPLRDWAGYAVLVGGGQGNAQ